MFFQNLFEKTKRNEPINKTNKMPILTFANPRQSVQHMPQAFHLPNQNQCLYVAQ